MFSQMCKHLSRKQLPASVPVCSKILYFRQFLCVKKIVSTCTLKAESNTTEFTTGDIPWENLYTENKVIPLTNKEQRLLRRKKPRQPENPRLLKIAIVGSPNAGKSTLANRLMGWRFSSVSNKVHTTRHKAQGVLTEGDTQIVFLDTPGMITPAKMRRHNLERSLLVDPHISLYQADLILVIVDVSEVWHRSRLDPLVLMALHMQPQKPAVLVLNKVDKIKRKQSLLNVTRTLTGGVVGGKKDWALPKPPPDDVNEDILFDRMDHFQTQNNANQNINDINNKTNACRIEKKADDEHCTMSDFDGEGYSVTSYGGTEDIVIEHVNSPITDQSDIDNQQYVKEENQLYTHGDRVDSVEENTMNELYSKDNWKVYERRLRKIEKVIYKDTSWKHFERVFMISAQSGDGVWQLKNHLLDTAQPGAWLYHSSMVTDQDPIEMARMCVQEKLMDNLPVEIPYKLSVTLALWDVDESDMLRAVFNISCPKKRHLLFALGKNGQTIRRVAGQAKQELMNTFRRDMTLQLMVKMSK